MRFPSAKIGVVNKIKQEVETHVKFLYQQISAAIVDPTLYSDDRNQLLRRRRIIFRIKNPQMYSKEQNQYFQMYLLKHPSSLDNPVSEFQISPLHIEFINHEFASKLIRKNIKLNSNLRTEVHINKSCVYSPYFHIYVSSVLEGYKKICSMFNTGSPTIENILNKLYGLSTNDTHTKKEIQGSDLMLYGIIGLTIMLDYIPVRDIGISRKYEGKSINRRSAIAPLNFMDQRI